jgi:hypothetical protein
MPPRERAGDDQERDDERNHPAPPSCGFDDGGRWRRRARLRGRILLVVHRFGGWVFQICTERGRAAITVRSRKAMRRAHEP